MLVQLWQQESYFGFKVGSEVIEDAKRIISYESSYNVTATNLAGRDRSFGLFQINMISISEGGGYELKGERLGVDKFGHEPSVYNPKFSSVNHGGENHTLIPKGVDEIPYGLHDMKTNMLVAKMMFQQAGYKWTDWSTKGHTKYPNGYSGVPGQIIK